MIRSPLISMAEGGDAEEAVKKLYLEQLGRPPDEAGLKFYVDQIKSGAKTPQEVARDLDRSTEGYNYDKQVITSAYGKNFGRGYDQAGLQFYMGQEDKELMSQEELARRIQVGARGTDVQRLKDNPTGFLDYTTEALRADPVGGGYAVDNPYVYDEKRIAELMRTGNISITPTGEYVQFVNPVTEQPVYSYYDPDTGEFIAKKGSHVLQPDRIRQAINMAQISGAIDKADADRMLKAISSDEAFRQAVGADPTPDTLYNFLGDPKAYVVLDTLGAQVGEDKQLADAKAEALDRQKILAEARKTTGMDIQPSMSLQEKIAAKLGIDYPFTEDNLTLDPLTGKKIRTFMTEQDILKNILDELGIEHDKTIISAPIDLSQRPETPTTPAVVGSTGDFTGLAFPQDRPTVIGETPAMLQFDPYSITSAGSGQQKSAEPQPYVPRATGSVDPSMGLLIGSAIGSLLPTPTGGGAVQGVTDIINAISKEKTPINWNQSSSVQETPGTYFGKNADELKHGGLATPLMKEGGMVPNYEEGGAATIAGGIDKIFSSPTVRGGLLGTLIAYLANQQAQNQAATAYRGIDMSKVGVIPPRTTTVGPVRFAPYRQYASLPEIPSSVSSPIDISALRASQSPLTSFTPTQGMVNPLVRPLNTILPMADGGSVREQTANLLQERLGSAPDASQIDYFSGIFGLDNQITPDELARLDTAVGIAKQSMGGQRNEFGGPTGEVGPDAARRFAEQYNQTYRPGEPVRFGEDPSQVVSRKAQEYGLYTDPNPQRQMENLVEIARMTNRAAVPSGQAYEQFNRDTLQYEPKVSQGMMGDYFTTSPYFYQTSVEDQIQNERAARVNAMRQKFPHVTDENELLRLYTQQSGFDPTRMASYDYKANIGSPGGLRLADGGAAYYTYGQQVDPLDYIGMDSRGMAYGGLAHGGLHHSDNVPMVQGRKDYRQGSAVTGPGDGQSDDIPAMLADGEYVFDADTVAQLGNGSTKAGSQMLDKFREEIRQHKRSAPVNKIPPPSKSPLAYLAAAQKKMKGARRG